MTKRKITLNMEKEFTYGETEANVSAQIVILLIYSIKILATGVPVSKTLIEYNSNSLEENDEEEKVPINIEFTEKNQILIIMKMLLTLDD